jgi:fructose/tagatose bisphosphate aldolase
LSIGRGGQGGDVDAVEPSSETSTATGRWPTRAQTVRQYGRAQLLDIFRALPRGVDVPVTLHLDHCPDRAVISDCRAGGWNSVLFDAHELDVAENLRQTTEVVAEARRTGAHVEGEIEGSRASRTTSARTRPAWHRAKTATFKKLVATAPTPAAGRARPKTS